MKIINIMAVSLDGFIATKPLEKDLSRMAMGFGCKEDQDHVRHQLQKADAVITGANSLRSSSAVWDQRTHKGHYPHWYILTTKGIAPDLAFWQQHEIPRTIVTPQTVPIYDQRVAQIQYSSVEQLDVVLLEEWQKAGYEQILLFGGGQVNRIFYNKNLVDELKITICPIIVAQYDAPRFVDPPIALPVQLELMSSHCLQNHVFLEYRIKK